MGSARVSNAKPIPMESTDKKSIKTLIKSLFHKKKEKPKIDKKESAEKAVSCDKETVENKQTEIPEKRITDKETIDNREDFNKETEVINTGNTVARILENFNKLNLKENISNKDDETNADDELENFVFKVIEEPRNERIHSHTSEDSGFSDTKETEKAEKSDEEDSKDDKDDLAEDLEKLDLDDKKKKKLQMVAVARQPTRNKHFSITSTIRPYPDQDSDNVRQINQINKHTLTGGQVIVNSQTDNFAEIDQALKSVEKHSQYLQNERETYLEDVLEYIHEDTNKSPIQTEFVVPQIFTSEIVDTPSYTNKPVEQNEIFKLLEDNVQGNYVANTSHEIDEFVQNNMIEKEDLTHIFNLVQNELNTNDFVTINYTYPTPPRSDTVPSPMSSSPSFYPSNSEYTLSPERSPIYNSDYEKYQEIPHFEDDNISATDKKARERTASISSMTMKQFKDMQKEIACQFSKKDCCAMSRKSCKELFQERLQKLNMEERKNLCLGVAKLDLKKAYGVLHHVLINVSSSSEKEDLHLVLFVQVCERLLAQNPAMFVSEAGLSLLESACLRCPDRPLLTRYLVQCIRTAIKTDPALVAGKEHVFHEGDLVMGCVRAGDACADVLSELIRTHDHQPPLFRLHHTNDNGYTALHVACSQHSAAKSRLHIIHVLLTHGGFDITEGDLKGGDTALHLAVNSATCDLNLILMMFKQVDRKDWKSLAHCPNLSSQTPIDLARLATKTTTRQNYPQEVLEFLKKCR